MNDHTETTYMSVRPGMIDTHFHSLVMAAKNLNCEILLTKAFQAGLSRGIDIGTSLNDLPERVKTLQAYAAGNPDLKGKILLAAGLYPGEAELRPAAESCHLLEQTITRIEEQYGVQIAAIGEIGLDFHWNYATPRQQQELFHNQISLANKYKLPILIHNRLAGQQVLEVLRNNPPRSGGIMHCFSDTLEVAKRSIDFGLHISFAGSLTYPKNNELRYIAGALPLKHILLETDSPYLAPQIRRGKPNHPGYIGYIYETLAREHSLQPEDIIHRLTINFSSLFPAAHTYAI